MTLAGTSPRLAGLSGMRHVTVELRWWGELIAVEEVAVGARPRRIEQVDGVPLLAPVVLTDRDGVAIERPGEALPFTHVRVRASQPERHPGLLPIGLDGWPLPMLLALSLHVFLIGTAMGGARLPWTDAHAILELGLPAPASPRRVSVTFAHPRGAAAPPVAAGPTAPDGTRGVGRGERRPRGVRAEPSSGILDVLAAVGWVSAWGTPDRTADAIAEVIAERTPGWEMDIGLGHAGSGADGDAVGVTLATGVASGGVGRDLPELASRNGEVPDAVGSCEDGGRCAAASLCVCCIGCGASVTGALSREVVRRTLARQRNALRSCVEAHGAAGASGRVDSVFLVAPSGATTVTSVTSDAGPAMETCVARALERTTFPTAEEPTGVHYPISFTLE